VDTPDARLGSFDKIYSENVGQLYKESGSGLQDTRGKIGTQTKTRKPVAVVAGRRNH